MRNHDEQSSTILNKHRAGLNFCIYNSQEDIPTLQGCFEELKRTHPNIWGARVL